VELATGSGFVVAPSGLVLTSAHVVAETTSSEAGRQEDGTRVTVENRRVEVVIGVDPARRVLEAWVAASDEDVDLAALQVTAAELPYLVLGDSDAIEPGRGVQVFGFPFGGQVEVARGAGAVPDATVSGGSLSAARADEAGDLRFLQTDAAVNPGSSGGPMLDEEGYVLGLVGMKLSQGPRAAGPGFAVAANVVKDFLEAHGLLGQLPVGRLRAGIVQSYDWKGLRLEAPDGFLDSSPARLHLDLGEIEGIDARAFRVPTALRPDALEAALLGGADLPGFVPAAATKSLAPEGGRRTRPGPRLGRAFGVTSGGQPFRVEYAVLPLRAEAIVVRYVGHPDAVAFNAALLRRSLRSLEARPLHASPPATPVAAEWDREGPRAGFTSVTLPNSLARLRVPAGWDQEPAAAEASWRACLGPPRAEAGLAIRHPAAYAVVLRAWPLGTVEDLVERPLGTCPGSSRRSRRLGVEYVVAETAVSRGREALLLELEAPAAAVPMLEGALERWAREVENTRPAAVSLSTMTLVDRITQDLTAAMKAHDAARTSTLRMAKAALKNREIDKKATLDDAEATRVVLGLVKQREDSVEQFVKGNRPELADKERAEIAVLRAYLPAEVSDEAVAAAVEKAVAETGASSAKDMGKVMKAALALLAAGGGAVDGRRVNEAVRKRLG
jgi:uncharacterized protein YqeY